MSIKLMAVVWTLDLSHSAQSVLLALADHAHDDGTDARPSLGYIAWKTGYSLSSVKHIIHALRLGGLVEVLEPGGGITSTVYRLCLERGKPKSPYHRRRSSLDRGSFAPGANGSTGGGAVSRKPSISESSFEPSLSLSLVPLADQLGGRVQRGGDGPQALADLWNEIVQTPKVLRLAGDRLRKAQARLREQPDLSWWRDLLSRIARTPFLRGENDRRWAASFDWLMVNDLNAVRVLEGKYDAGKGETMTERAERYAGYARRAKG